MLFMHDQHHFHHHMRLPAQRQVPRSTSTLSGWSMQLNKRRRRGRVTLRGWGRVVGAAVTAMMQER